ncbi:MAG: hypothetical protein MR939_06150 [Clostridiales bacterium]|nr:hypothetical protein [Clostridiales bacterium]MDD7386409.1 hypothetical protein [Bacillota bacterium]
MTELEMIQRAKMYMEKLAQGIDPISDQEIPEDSVLNNVRLARCFFYVSGVLDQVIANGGNVKKTPKKNFYVTEEELRRLNPSPEPIRITQFVELVMNAINDPDRKKLKTTTITDWLIEKGFLSKQADTDGKSKRLPTAMGEQIGLAVKLREGQYGTYQAVYYSEEAQRFLLDHLQEMLQAEK